MARGANVKTGIVIGMNTKGLRKGLAEFGSIMTGLRSGLQMVRGSMRTLTNAFGSVIKALLVIAIFMHLKDSARILWIVAFSGVMWVVVLLVLSMSDVVSRNWVPQPETWL